MNTPSIVPNLYPVSPEAITELEKRVTIPIELRDFWLTHGHGFFMEDVDGNLIDPDIANRLVSPEEVLELLDNTVDLAGEFAHGIPFFERNDRRYLLISPEGKILSAEVDIRCVANSFEEFMERIVCEPTFYDDGIDDDPL